MFKASDGHVLINAIVAPNLLGLDYSPSQCVGLADDQWNLHTPRYPDVTDLILPLCGIRGPNEMASFQFLAIRHVTLHRYGISLLFGPKDDPNGAMYWLNLETLTVEYLDYGIYDKDTIERVEPANGTVQLAHQARVFKVSGRTWRHFKLVYSAASILYFGSRGNSFGPCGRRDSWR